MKNGHRPDYRPESIYAVLSNYEHVLATGRMPARGERLSTRPPPPNEAATAGVSRVKADVELALKSLPLDVLLIVFMNTALKHSTFNRRRDAAGWREKIGDYFNLTPGQVSDITRQGLEEVCKYLNGGRVGAPDGTS